MVATTLAVLHGLRESVPAPRHLRHSLRRIQTVVVCRQTVLQSDIRSEFIHCQRTTVIRFSTISRARRS